MSFEYNGFVYRDLEPQVRYDAEQVQLLKQADITINENLQTINTEIDGKLTKPANPSADSAVTILADGTVGTKPLSEIGGGKLYMHSLHIEGNDGVFLNKANFNAISSYDSFITKSNILSINISKFAIVNNGDYIRDNTDFYKLNSVYIEGNIIVVNYFENSSDVSKIGSRYININSDDTRISDQTVTEL